jgi:predicted enzyme related to lactoylglutathione lyase
VVKNAINWFEIPATNFDRAVAFYRTALGQDIQVGEFAGVPHGFFPADEQGVAGAIVAGPAVDGFEHAPSERGPTIYLNAGDQIEAIVARVADAGGAVVVPPTAIPPQGWIALIRDSEGNRVGLHQPPA